MSGTVLYTGRDSKCKDHRIHIEIFSKDRCAFRGDVNYRITEPYKEIPSVKDSSGGVFPLCGFRLVPDCVWKVVGEKIAGKYELQFGKIEPQINYGVAMNGWFFYFDGKLERGRDFDTMVEDIVHAQDELEVTLSQFEDRRSDRILRIAG